MEQQNSTAVHLKMKDDDVADEKSAELTQKFDAVRTALQQNDDKEVSKNIAEFIKLWNLDAVTNQFYNNGIYKEFCTLVTANINKQQNIVLDREIFTILKFVPASNLATFSAQLSKTQDAKFLGAYIDLLASAKCYDQLVGLADLNDGLYFDKIQETLICQHDDVDAVLEFVERYRGRANISEISSRFSDYTWSLNRQRSFRAMEKFAKCRAINQKINEIGREVRKQQEIEEIANKISKF